jgi:hypothetical protein
LEYRKSYSSTLWVEKLTFSVVLSILITKSMRSAQHVMYGKANKRGLRWLKLFCQWGFLNVQYAQYDLVLAGKFTNEGKSLKWEYESLFQSIHHEMCQFMWKNHNLPKLWYNPKSISKVQLYLENKLALNISVSCKLIQLILWENESKQQQAKGEDIVLLPNTWYFKWLKSHFDTVDIQLYISFQKIFPYQKLFHRIQRFLSIKSIQKVTGRVQKKLDYLVRHRSRLSLAGSELRRSTNKTKHYKCSTMYIRGTNFEERNDLYWFEKSGLDPKDVVIIFFSDAYPASSEEIQSLNQQGFNYILCKDNIVENSSDSVWSPSHQFRKLRKRTFKHTLHLLRQTSINPIRMWQLFHLVILMRQIDWYQDLFDAYDIRVNIVQMYDIPGAVALDNLDGVQIWVQWSLWHFVHPLLPVGSHVSFKWTQSASHMFLKAKADEQENVLCSGFIYDHFFNKHNIQLQSEAIRRQLTNAGAQFIISLFDEPIHPDMNTREMILEYYSIFLNECIQDQRIGLIIKPKVNNSTLKLNELQLLFEKTKKTGRCVILQNIQVDKGTIKAKNSNFPLLAALASDLSVSLMSSTGYESWLSGIPAIYYDPYHLEEGLLYKNQNSSKLVYQNIDKMMEEIREYLQSPKGTTLGDHQCIAEHLDPFQDGLAGSRIGIYTRWLLYDLNSKKSQDQALLNANQKYADTWGQENLIGRT